MTASIPCRDSYRRMHRELCPLLPASFTGRHRGRALVGPEIDLAQGSVELRWSWGCPGVTTAASGTLRPSHTRYILVLNPPRERAA